ncbi:coiled-coil domain-containing protein [Psychrobacter pacificensis]|uniref:coiled-coil domain-containing protein n=1 Tax=Psychrobacter pacificensis TaxID=112002 RepID=UPI001CBB41DE|nr:hypothetical protein [Psychrobacter pacificensis]MBZ1392674.1 hypothetical protein [Psychrobacter pacificensis]|tara:strand:- start:4473 stop:5492 length:1020 start_codon:yes stop_codon:yes gene_type:complete
MSYFFSEKPKGYDTHLRFSTFLEILLNISDDSIYSSIGFLQYNHFQDKVCAYFLEEISYEAVGFSNGSRVISDLLHEIKDKHPGAERVSRDLPKSIVDRLRSIYFDPIELNQLDFIAKTGFDFTDKVDVSMVAQHDFIMEQRLIEDRLSDFVIKETLADKIKRPIKVPIENIINLVEHFNHKFIIKNNQLELVNHDIFRPDYSIFKPVKLDSEINLVRKDESEQTDEQDPIAINSDAQAQIDSLTRQLKQTEKRLANATDQLDENTATSYQTTIGMLLELMTAPKGMDNKAPFSSEAVIIGMATEESIFKQGKTSLQKRFKAAKDALADERKKPHNLKK